MKLGADDGTFRQEWLHEGLLKIKTFREVLAGVGVLLAEDLLLDEMENHVTHILTFSDAPLARQRGGHGAELFEREIAETFQQLRAGDMAHLAAIGFRDPLEREIQRVLEEKVGLRIKALVALQDRNHRLIKLHGLHARNMPE